MFATESQFSSLLLDLYRGVAEPHSWTRALNLISESFRDSAIFFGSFAPDGSSKMAAHSVDPKCAELIGGPLANPGANPFIAPMMIKPVGKAFSTAAMCGEAALIRSPLYEQALRPYGQRYTIGALLERNRRSVRTFSLTRPGGAGDYSDEETNSIDRILPHLIRVIHLRETFGNIQLQSLAAFAALDAVERAIVILRPDLRILFANQEARRIFELDDGVSSTSAGLAVDNRHAAERLRNLFQSIARDDPVAVSLAAPISVPRPSGKLPFALSLVPAPELLGGGLSGLAVSLTIVDPERHTSPSVVLVREIYGLTPAEANLAVALCDHELKQAARRLGISVNTAKSQLQAIFQKVGVTRQSALVRMITLHCGR